jgi:hypothetical protein
MSDLSPQSGPKRTLMIQIVVTDWLELDLVIKISDGYCPDCGQNEGRAGRECPHHIPWRH